MNTMTLIIVLLTVMVAFDIVILAMFLKLKKHEELIYQVMDIHTITLVKLTNRMIEEVKRNVSKA